MNRIIQFFKPFIQSSDSFRGQEEDESVSLLLRWHPYTIFNKVVLVLIAFLLPFLIGRMGSSYISSNGLYSLFFFLVSIWYLLIWLGFFYSLTIYTLNMVVVTNKRIIYREQKGLFNRTNSELHLSRIQDISTHTQGAIETFFHFGELLIQTAGTEEKFNFPMIPDPEHAKDVIMKLVNQEHLHRSNV